MALGGLILAKNYLDYDCILYNVNSMGCRKQGCDAAPYFRNFSTPFIATKNI